MMRGECLCSLFLVLVFVFARANKVPKNVVLFWKTFALAWVVYYTGFWVRKKKRQRKVRRCMFG